MVMYQVINDETVEVVRHGEDILPASHLLLKEIIGQLVLELTQGEDNE